MAIDIPGYTILRPLGQGGMATVYLAVQLSLGREVALKILSPALSGDPIASERFLREARIAAKLHHRHIIAIHDVGVHAGVAYMAMEYEPAGTVSPVAGQRPEANQVLRIVRDIAEALGYAHSEGVVHRDVKPENILRRRDGACVLSDFGIARAVESDSPLTREGTSVGTPYYMSPEQLRGEHVDGRADLYSLGVVLYQLLTGELPYRGADGLVIGMQHLSAPTPRLPGSVAQAQALIDAMMAKAPDDRPQTAADVVRRIDALLSGETPIHTLAMAAAPARPRRSVAWRIGVPAALAAVLLVLVLAWSFHGQPPVRSNGAPAAASVAATPARSIAVLPFVNMSSDKEQDYFSDGLSEELLNQLAQLPQLRVVARTSSFSFKGKEVDVATIAKALDVAYVLEGSVRKSGSTLRITAQLVRASDSSHLWSQSYDRQLSDVFKIQDEISAAVVDALKVKLLQSQQVANPHQTASIEAYSQYLLGNQFLIVDTPEGRRRSVLAYQQAIALDSHYAPAYAKLARAQFLRIVYAGTTAESVAAIQGAMEAADQAIALAPDLADGYIARGMLRQNVSWDWAGAQADFEKALALDAGASIAQSSYGWFQASMGRVPEAIRAHRRATELDPLSDFAWSSLANVLITAGQLPEALQAVNRALAINPESQFANWILGATELLQGRPHEALSVFRRSDEAFRLSGAAMAEHSLGHAQASQAALDELISRFGQTWAMQVADVHAWRGENDQAFAWLQRAYDQRDVGLCEIKKDVWLRTLHSDARYAALLKKMGLPP
ncbi:serine/threonine-protein kinase [soil metagenome]